MRAVSWLLTCQYNHFVAARLESLPMTPAFNVPRKMEPKMSNPQDLSTPVFTPGGTPASGWRAGIALLLAGVAAAALAVLALVSWREGGAPAFSAGALGVRYGVQLQNGQMYYGLLREMGPRHLQLEDIYYVQAFTGADGRPANRVVSRQKNDWHGPQTITIPLDKVVTIEQVGDTSQLARLIEQDKTAR
jgi:hypothetical protein